MAVLICLAASLHSRHPRTACFPAGYRDWTVAKFKFESKGACATTTRTAGARELGQVRDGSIIVDEKLHAKLGDDGVWREDGMRTWR